MRKSLLYRMTAAKTVVALHKQPGGKVTPITLDKFGEDGASARRELLGSQEIDAFRLCGDPDGLCFVAWVVKGANTRDGLNFIVRRGAFNDLVRGPVLIQKVLPENDLSEPFTANEVEQLTALLEGHGSYPDVDGVTTVSPLLAGVTLQELLRQGVISMEDLNANQ